MKLPPAIISYPQQSPALFDYEEFRSKVFSEGVWFWWEYGLHCPCKLTLEVGQPTNQYQVQTYRAKVRCPGCNGEGILFQEGQYVPGIISGFGETSRSSPIFAQIEIGDMSVSMLRENFLGENDRLTLVTDPVVVSEVVQKTDENPIRLRHPIVPKRLYLGTWDHPTEISADPCPTKKEVRVIHARASDADGNLLPGELVEGDDIIIDDDTGLFEAPSVAVGGGISLRYHTFQVFRVAGTIKQARVVPLRDGCLLPEEGDGPNQFLLRPQQMGLGALSNPSATFLPPKFNP